MKIQIKNFRVVLLVFLLICGFITNAQSHRELTKDSEKAYENQKFDDAVFFAINALMKEPTYTKAVEALQLALPAAIRSNENKIVQLKESTASFSGDITVDECQEIVSRYNTLNKINESILNLPVIQLKKGGPITFESKNYNSELREAKEALMSNKELAAEQHYQNGLELLKINDIEKSKSAAKEFKKSLSFIPDYKDASSMYEQARKMGIKRIAIIPFENKSGKDYYGAVGEMLTDNVITLLMENTAAMEFLEIISRDQLQQVINEQNLGTSGIISENSAIELGKILGVHELLVGQITQINSSTTPTTSSSFQNENTIYSKQGNYKVYAEVTEYAKGASASINGSYKIIDVKTAKMKSSDSFKKEYTFYSNWGTFRGDEQALSYSSQRLCSQREQNPPSDEERVNIVVEKLGSSLAETLIKYVR